MSPVPALTQSPSTSPTSAPLVTPGNYPDPSKIVMATTAPTPAGPAHTTAEEDLVTSTTYLPHHHGTKLGTFEAQYEFNVHPNYNKHLTDIFESNFYHKALTRTHNIPHHLHTRTSTYTTLHIFIFTFTFTYVCRGC